MKIIERVLAKIYNKAKKAADNAYLDSLRMGVCISDKAEVYLTTKFTTLSGKKEDIEIGEYSHIRGELFTYFGGKVHVGDYCYIGERTKIIAEQNMWIGNRVLIAHDCNIFDNNTHPINSKERHEHYKEIITVGHPDVSLNSQMVRIEDDVWVGCNVTILKGVTLGEGAIVGAGSVVTKSIPAHCIAVGNPAEIVKCLCDEKGKSI